MPVPRPLGSASGAHRPSRCTAGQVGQAKSCGGNRIIPPLRASAKGEQYPTPRVFGIHSWCPTSRLAWKRSGHYTGTRTTSEGLWEAQVAPFAGLKRFPQGVSSMGCPRGTASFDACDLGFSVELRRIELLTSSMPC